MKFHAPPDSNDDATSANTESAGQTTKTSPFGLFKMKEKPAADQIAVGSAFAAYRKEAAPVHMSSKYQ